MIFPLRLRTGEAWQAAFQDGAEFAAGVADATEAVEHVGVAQAGAQIVAVDFERARIVIARRFETGARSLC
ncbi:MAG TPA: hypothetical protein VM915_01530, partial [Verrucomicrobiae bacterium]|nr:hypothetical protein [Verrucomicrobiae bacterium]